MSELIPCQSCGRKFERSAEQCPHCQFSRPSAKRHKSKGVAGALALLIGGLGVHRFYLGQWWGIFYLLFIWTFIPALVAFVEGIVFLCTDQEIWDRKYNEGMSQKTSSSTIVMIAAVAAFVGIAMFGTLAAISIPAYQDYTLRTKVVSSLQYGMQAAVAAEKYFIANGKYPRTLQEAGFNGTNPDSTVEIKSEERDLFLIVTLHGLAPIDGKSYSLEPGNDSQSALVCKSIDLPQEYLPVHCRGSER